MPVKLTPKEADEMALALKDELLKTHSREELISILREIEGPAWPNEYVNRDTGKVYAPHTSQEYEYVYNDSIPFPAILGGEGAGKSTASIIKVLERVRRSMNGVMASPDLPHFKKSLWPEFQRWCPWEQVIEKHRDRGHFAWEPYAPFFLGFRNGVLLQCGGLDDPKKWRGPNISFALLDEIAVKSKPDAVKVLSGRVRIPGPNGEPPQLFISTTPEMHWLHDYYGPLKCRCNNCGDDCGVYIQRGADEVCPECESDDLVIDDPLESFKRKSFVAIIPTILNIANLSEGFIENRRSTLTESEARVFLEAAWEDVASGQPFLPSMIWWDDCKGKVPELDKDTPIILVADAATGRDSGDSDCFGIMALSRHPDPKKTKTSVAVRFSQTWQAKAGQRLDFRGTERNPGPERVLLRFCGWRLSKDGGMEKVGDGYNVKSIVADPTELHDMIARFNSKRVAWMREFGQGVERLRADNDLLRLIQEKRVLHDGDDTLRRHVKNADRKVDTESKKLRIVKRLDNLKIDLAICLSMGAYEVLRLNLA